MAVRAVSPSLPQTSPGNVFRILHELLDSGGVVRYSVDALRRIVGQPKQTRALLRFLGLVERTGQLSQGILQWRGGSRRGFGRFLKNRVEDRYARVGQGLFRKLWNPGIATESLRGEVADRIEHWARKRDGGRVEAAALNQMTACLLALRDAVLHDCDPGWLARQHGGLAVAAATESPAHLAGVETLSGGAATEAATAAPSPAPLESDSMPPADWHSHWAEPGAAAPGDETVMPRQCDASRRLVDALGVAPVLKDRARQLVIEADRIHVHDGGTIFERVRLRVE